MERYEDLKLGGLFCGFFWARDISGIIFQKLGSNCEILDYGLVSQKSLDLFVGSLR
jgi:hypothetical protein